MLAIEIRARLELERLLHGHFGDDAEARTRRRILATGNTGVRVPGKRPTRFEPRAPRAPHPDDMVDFYDDGAAVWCGRCTRRARRSTAWHWQQFWEAECVPVESDAPLNSIVVRRNYWAETAPREYEAFRLQFVERHAVAPEAIAWTGDPMSPFHCRCCMAYWAPVVARRDFARRRGAAYVGACHGADGAADRALRLATFVAGPGAARHAWRLAPDGRLAVCSRCGFYTDDAPYRSSMIAAKDCDLAALRHAPWHGNLVFHAEWGWYGVHLFVRQPGDDDVGHPLGLVLGA